MQISIKGLYKGLGISIICTIPALSAYLAVYEIMKSNLELPIHNDRILRHAVSAGGAELVSGLLWTPMEVLKQHLQVNPSISLLEKFKTLSREYGPISLYRGYWITLVSFVPYSMIYFSLFEEFQHRKQALNNNQTFVQILKNAALASSIASILTSPLDLLKTRWQLQPRYSRIFSWLYSQLTNIPIKDWIMGAIGRTIWVTPNGAISLSTYEYLKSL